MGKFNNRHKQKSVFLENTVSLVLKVRSIAVIINSG